MKKILLVILFILVPLISYSQGIYADSVKSGDTTMNIRESGSYTYALIYMYNSGVRQDTIVVHSQSYRVGMWAPVSLIDLYNSDSTKYKYIIIAPGEYRFFLLNVPCPNWFRFTSLGRIAPTEKRVDIEVNFKK